MSAIPVIGITGGVGSGKSTAAAIFAQLGCEVIDADALGHELLRRDPAVRAAVRETFGQEVFDFEGQIDRKTLGRIVFSDVLQMRRLEDILHPLMRAAFEQRISHVRRAAEARAMVLDAAVLFKAGWDKLCTHTVFVESPLEQRLARVAESRGWSKDDLLKREAAQFPLDRKRQYCCHTLQNVKDVSHLQGQVTRLLDDILA